MLFQPDYESVGEVKYRNRFSATTRVNDGDLDDL